MRASFAPVTLPRSPGLVPGLALGMALALAPTAVALPQEPLPRVDPTPFEFATTFRQTGFPFGYPDRLRLRHLQVHDGLAGQVRPIAAVAIRRSVTDGATVPTFTAEVSLRLSTARTTAATIASRFDDNVGLDVVEVLPRSTVSFPDTGGPYDGPAPFDFVLPADRPFAFGGAGPLCVDLRVWSHTSATPAQFALYAEGDTHQATFGTACGGTRLQTTMTPTEATHAVTGAPPGAPMILLFGIEFDSVFEFALPVDLTPLGAPDCWLSLEPFADARGFADESGAFELTVPIDSAPPGAFYGCQAITVQPGLNALGALFTEASLVLPLSGRVLGRVWAEDPDATEGLRQPVFGLVVEVR